jgi:signal transduction histidine kinase
MTITEVAVRTPGLGDAATQLAWLSPCAASLVALARAPTAAAWGQVRSDPGCVLLLVREAFPARSISGLSFFPALLGEPHVLEAVLRHLRESPAGWVDWQDALLRPIYQASITYARSAAAVAEQLDSCAVDNAWVGALLAPLGWLAAAAVDPMQTTGCLTDITRCPGRTWGLEPAAIARRLCHSWRLPAWLATICGHLALPLPVAQTLGADPALFQVVQLAVGLVQEQGAGLALDVPAPAEVAAALGLATPEFEAVRRSIARSIDQPLPELAWQPPQRLPLLPDLLSLAVDKLRLGDRPTLSLLERQVDCLQRALVEQRQEEENRLQVQKLSAMAELAAGAGHEINNPLAVISGQAQYLLSHEEEPARRRALQTITSQAQRIHQILMELMQFARPPAPQRQILDAGNLMQEVAVVLQGLANERKVRLVCTSPGMLLGIHADPAQARTALSCLLRNAIEAAPAEGWAGVRAEPAGSASVVFIVEDNGPGLTQVEREHLFDPFYSGRKAGRGRGLGLPTAWRLAHQHAGEVRFDDTCQTPTRFLLTLPRANLPEPRPVVVEERPAVNGCHLPAAVPG